MHPLAPLPVARLVGTLLLVQGMVIAAFWKVLHYAVGVGLERYTGSTGRLARSLFRKDREIMELLNFAGDLLPILFVLALLVMLAGILVLAFPQQALQIMRAFRLIQDAPASETGAR